LDKLSIVLPSGQQIDEVLLEKHIGISKEYNVFELTNAISVKDLPRAINIVRYFEANPKAGELVPVIAILFKFFSQLMRIHFLENKSRESVASVLKIHPFVAGELLKSRTEFPPKKVAENIELLYAYDLKAKGVGNATQANGELMRELVMQLIL
jgi:DNA polymerase-3 subunit delta